MGRPLLALAVLCGKVAAATDARLELVSQKDIDFAKTLEELDEKACGHPLLGGSAWLVENAHLVDESPDLLSSEAGHNSLKARLTSGEEFDAGGYVSDVMGKGAFVLPMFLAITMIFVSCGTCCQYKFQCCRCRSRKRVFGKRYKLFFWVLLMVLLFLIIYEGFFEAWKGILEVEVGLENFVCGAMELVHVTFNGHLEEPTFPGTIATLRDIEYIQDFLNEGTEFDRGLDHVIDKVGTLYKAAKPLRETFGLLDGLHGDLFAAPNECKLCEEVHTKKAAAIAELDANAGYKLAMLALTDLKPSESDKTKILDGISAATGPLLNLQEQMRDVGEGLSNNVEELISTWLPGMQIAMFVVTSLTVGCALLLVFCGCTSAFKFTFYETVKLPAKPDEKREETTALVEAEGGTDAGESKEAAAAEIFNPYNPSVQFWASRTWCWGFCYCITTLFIGALVSAALVPVTESCMLLTELKRDSSAVDNFGHTMNDKEQMKALVDGCLIANSDEPALLMDILTIPGADSNFTTVKERLAADVDKTMTDLFGDLLEFTEAPYADVQMSPKITEFREIFRRDPADLKADLTNADYACPLFQDAFGRECDTKDYASDCLLNSLGSDYANMNMMKLQRTCNRDEFVKYLREFGNGAGRLDMSLIKFNMAMGEKDQITDAFRKVKDEHITNTVAELSAKTDCRYIGIYYKQLSTGLCAQAVVGINDMVDASLWSSYFAVALAVAMYLLWRMALDNYDHHADLAPSEVQAQLEEEDRLRAEADRTGWVLTSGLATEDQAMDPSMIPESVRQRQAELAAEPFD